jgi:hypothetical protein
MFSKFLLEIFIIPTFVCIKTINMSKISIKTKISNVLRGQNGKVLVDLKWLGTGGAFDYEEKNSSLLMRTNTGKTILIDCGSTVYEQLRKGELVENIDYLFLTHCHDDHIGSISALIYHRYFLYQKKTTVICSQEVGNILASYLLGVCGHASDQFVITSTLSPDNSGFDSFIIDTTGYHKKDMPTSGFIFEFNNQEEKFLVVYSGDINVPFIPFLSKSLKMIWDINESTIDSLNKIFIFHDATAYTYPNQAHCHFKELEASMEIFKNIFIYHHSKLEAQTILKENSAFKSMTLMEKDLVIVEDYGI